MNTIPDIFEMEVVLREGSLWLTGTPSAFGAATLVLPDGGRLAVDPGDPLRIVALAVEEPAECPPLALLVGQSTATGLQAMLDSMELHPVAVCPEPAATAWARWALVSWYRRWTPLAVPDGEALFDVALAALTAGDDALAAAAFTQAAPAAVGVASLVAAGPQMLKDNFAAVAARAVEVLGGQPAAQQWAQAAAASAVAELATDLRLPEPAMPALLGGQEVLSSTSVDWGVVPPRLLTTDEGGVFVRADGNTVQVQALPHPLLDPAGGPAGSLLAQVRDRDGRPLIAVPLLWDGTDGLFTATTELDQAPKDMTVVVFSAAHPPPSPNPPDEKAARAQRFAVRALARVRLARAATALGIGVPEGWMAQAGGYADAAVRTYREAATGDPRLTNLGADMQAWVDRVESGSNAPPDPLRGPRIPDPQDTAEAPLLCEMLHAQRLASRVGHHG